MSPQQIADIQSSFGQLAPHAEQVASRFYSRLFETAPEVRPLFKGNIAEQGQKLMATLGVIVTGLNDLQTLLPVAADLAKRHVGYGVEPNHYAKVGAALIDTLERELGSALFTSDVRDAWASAYHTLAQAMIAAAYPEPR